MTDRIHNEPTTGPGAEIEGEEESRSWYLPGKEPFPPRRNTNKSGNPVGVLYLGFSNEIKVQLFSEFLSVTFREGDFVFRVYKNCRVEFVI
ncbi:hypothetical protein SAMN05443144_105120 [Fodinibius roseus]|uniref:Uncharacterized protein n=1 Tax=Fodinibius roseus TaxID=1194090 RepID=A0A1M4YPF7_9BACT|nr:hypothetical protein [Fodinibius roseus]SHF07601.1 hypothetical protein SAMN05443144_105120 [Fodinibius roseus]